MLDNATCQNIVYDYATVPTIRAFSRSSAFIRALMGPFGSGKSSGCVWEIIRRGLAQAPGEDGKRRTRWLVVRNTYPELRDTTIRTFHDWFPPDLFGVYNKIEHTYLITNLAPDTVVEVIFLALDSLKDARKLLSMELTGAWLNEAREIPRAVVDMLQGRVGRYPAVKDGGCTWSGIIMDTNPPDTDSWFYRMFEEGARDGAEIFKQPAGLGKSAENVLHLPKDYYKNLAVGKDPEFVKVYCNGQYGFVQDGKPVYPGYNDVLHCAEVSVIPGRIYRGWDFGLTPACVFLQSSASGRVMVIDEIVSDDCGIDRFSDEVLLFSRERYPGNVFVDYGDPAGQQRAQTDERTCFDILQGKGINIEGGEQSLTIRLESVKKPLNTMIDGQPGFVMSQRCRTLRKGFQGAYRYKRVQVSGERFGDEPEKNAYSHIHDALQYPLTKIMGPLLRGESVVTAKPERLEEYAGNWMGA